MTWTPAAHADDVIEAAVSLATFAATSPGLAARPAVRREVLRMYLLPLVTQGTLPRKGDTRYVSAGTAAAAVGVRLEHEHVYTRSYLTDLILQNPYEPAVRWILTNLAIAATVTHDEHTRLTRVPKTIEGWDRYAAAEVVATDLLTDLPVATMQIPDWIQHPGHQITTTRVSIPADAVDRLLATAELRDLLDPERTDLRGTTDWPMRRAEAFECISIVSRAAGHQFESIAAAREQLFAGAVGGGFGIRDWMQDAVVHLLVSHHPSET